ncbi:MAG: glycosyltransferase family 39 protein [Myxococcales bacterium]
MAQISGEEAGTSSPASTTSSPARRVLRWLQGYARSLDLGEVVGVLAVVSLCVLIRVLRLHPIEYYDDEVTRWHFVRQWFYANDFTHAPWTHHMARFGINVPLYFFQALLGRSASVYFVWPITAFTLQVLLVFLTTKRLAGYATAVLAALLLSVFTGMDRGACQLLPDGFGGTAMILVCYLLVRYQEASHERRMPWLVGAGLAFVWAYTVKESNLLFVPGLGLGVWRCRGRFLDGVLFMAILFAAIGLETAWFRAFTVYSSRFAIVEESHGIATVKTLWNLFDRFTRLELPWQVLIYTWFLAGIWLLGTRDRRIQLLLIVPATFVFLLTFMVRGLDPIVIWTRFFSRYFEPAAPLFVIPVALFLAELGRRIWSTHAPARLAPLAARLSREGAAVTVFACALVGMVEYALEKPSLPDHPLRETIRISRITNDAYRRNLPIVEARAKRGELEERRVRPLKAVYGIYLRDALIATSDLAKAGRLPDILEAVRDSKRFSYVVHDARAYSGADIEDWVEQGCAVVLTEEKNHLNAAPGVPSVVLERTELLPATCHPPQH